MRTIWIEFKTNVGTWTIFLLLFGVLSGVWQLIGVWQFHTFLSFTYNMELYDQTLLETNISLCKRRSNATRLHNCVPVFHGGRCLCVQSYAPGPMVWNH